MSEINIVIEPLMSKQPIEIQMTVPGPPGDPTLLIDDAAAALDKTYSSSKVEELVDGADQNASEVPYDNSTSGLTATDTQGAIDEINGDLAAHKEDYANQNMKAKNDIINSNFINGTTGWIAYYSSLAATSGSMQIIGNGTLNRAYAIQRPYGTVVQFPNQKFYLSATFKSKNTDCKKILLTFVAEGTTDLVLQEVTMPQIDIAYTLSGIGTITTERVLRILCEHQYADATMSNGKIIEITKPLFINLTQIFGSGNEPSKEEMDELIKILGGWFEGEITINEATQANWLLGKIRVGESQLVETTNIGMSMKHRALVIPTADANYGNPVIDQLRSSGFTVDLISPSMFVRHFDELNHDILVVPVRIIIPHYEELTAQQYKNKLVQWLSKGKKAIFLASSTLTRIEKSNADGTLVENVSMSDIFTFSVSFASGYDLSGNFTRIEPGELTTDNIIDERYKPQNFVLHCYGFLGGVKSIVRAVQGTTIADCVVIKPNQYILVGWGGSLTGQNLKDIAGYRYVDVGLLAKRLIGDKSNVSLAFDCKHNKKIAASGIDNDVTTDKDAIRAYVEAYKGRPLEMGTYVSKLTPSLANFYKSLTNVELNSHSTYHTVDRDTVVDELHIIPTKQYIRLEAPYLAEIEYIKTIDELITFASSTTLSQGMYKIDDYGIVTFHSSDVGKRVKIKYTHIKESDEWVGSIYKLRDLGALTNNSLYTTHSYKSVHPTSIALAKREGVTICPYEDFPSNAMFHYIVNSGLVDKLTPLIGTGFTLGYGRPGWDAMFHYPKAYSKETHLPEMVADSDRRNFPYLWYSHDFLFSKNYWAGIWVDSQAIYDADWKKTTFEETVAYAQEMVSWALDYLDGKNVYWMTRSDYSRWFESLNKSVEYEIKKIGEVTDILVTNKGGEVLKGLTFRIKSTSTPTQVYTLQGETLPFIFLNGEIKLCLDIQPGVSRLIRII